MSHSYQAPQTLQKLIAIEKELISDYGQSFKNVMGIIFSFNDPIKYDCTPTDAIIFGWTGVNGDHFAFVTYNHKITDLNQAPIIFVQPMNPDNEVMIAANNLTEFLSLYIELKEFYILERFVYCETESDFKRDYEKFYRSHIDSNKHRYRIFTDRLKSTFEIPRIENVYKYVRGLNPWK